MRWQSTGEVRVPRDNEPFLTFAPNNRDQSRIVLQDPEASSLRTQPRVIMETVPPPLDESPSR